MKNICIEDGNCTSNRYENENFRSLHNRVAKLENKTYCEFDILEEQTVELNDDGVTWSKIGGLDITRCKQGFTSSDSTLFVGESGIYLFNGVSDIQINKGATIYYGLSKNEEVLQYQTTPHTFLNQAKISTISITGLIDLEEGDELEVWVKGDGTSGLILTISNLDTTYVEV